jgi:hypothetical protein
LREGTLSSGPAAATALSEPSNIVSIVHGIAVFKFTKRGMAQIS